MAGIQIGGIASGMDTESIITQLMSIESAPRARTAPQQVTAQARQDALRQIDTKLTNLKLAAGDLRSASIWTPTQAISSGNESVLTARQVTGAAPGGYTVNVASLASADSRTYQWNAGGGNLTVDYKSAGSAQSKSFDLTGKSLDDAVSTINSDDSAPVWAVNVGGKLSLSRRDTGDHANWGFDASGPAIGAQTASRDGSNASYTVAGDATVYSSHTNVATDGLPGIELTFKSTGTSTPTVSTPAAKPTDVATKLKAFVSAYNDAVDLVRSKLTEKRVVNPQSDDDAKLGALFGDDSLDSVLTSMRQAISSAGRDSSGGCGRPSRAPGWARWACRSRRPAAAPRPTRSPASSPSTRRPSTRRGPPGRARSRPSWALPMPPASRSPSRASSTRSPGPATGSWTSASATPTAS